MKISIIIPVYNEEKTLEEILSRVAAADIPEELEKEIVIIDDGSSDGTKNMLEGLGQQYKVIRHAKNQGKGKAIRTGLENISGDIVLIQDADLEYDPNDYQRLLAPILAKESLIVYGSRFLSQNHRPRYKVFYLGNKFLSVLFSFLYQHKISDIETGYKVFAVEVLEGISLRSNSFSFEPEITSKLVKAGHRIKEVPISYVSRSYKAGKKIGWHDGVVAIYTIIKYRFKK